ncbi:hypothetical protein CDAR_7281 [Caerostris darwini]|uniref:Uncharacterized protein n=1 Tax=Caerostris darwini TaxID=1538125 RepID=A0AAV4VLC5_9ARAC|nr:hypothetical protein CDAR_7281 [Caerostris darwini]
MSTYYNKCSCNKVSNITISRSRPQLFKSSSGLFLTVRIATVKACAGNLEGGEGGRRTSPPVVTSGSWAQVRPGRKKNTLSGDMFTYQLLFAFFEHHIL